MVFNMAYPAVPAATTSSVSITQPAGHENALSRAWLETMVHRVMISFSILGKTNKICPPKPSNQPDEQVPAVLIKDG